MAREYKIFISHSWDHSKDRENLQKLLNDRGYLHVEFAEVPKDEPINSTNENYIKTKLKEKIKNSNIVLALAGIYASHSDWMEWELDKADKLGIPIVGVIPWGQTRISKVVSSCSIVDVNWDTESIVEAIREHAN